MNTENLKPGEWITIVEPLSETCPFGEFIPECPWIGRPLKVASINSPFVAVLAQTGFGWGTIPLDVRKYNLSRVNQTYVNSFFRIRSKVKEEIMETDELLIFKPEKENKC